MEWKKILVTGSSGLIGSEMVGYFCNYSQEVVGVDNNQRKEFFGEDGDTSAVLSRLQEIPNFRHVGLDIRDRDSVLQLFENERFDGIIHCASQPSHDLAARIPFVDFEVNAMGTLNLLEANRRFCPESPFVFFSTNKVYGDAPNHLPLMELETRWEFEKPEQRHGIDEELSIDHCVHSLFGVSKASADLMVQEYGKNFGMPTVSLRGGCLTGPNHRGAELHGFLSYLIKCCVTQKPYTIFGYKGKQVRDNIHSLDVARCVYHVMKNPKCGEVYNLGGGAKNSCSLLEAIQKIESLTGKKMQTSYSEKNRTGDHICYYSDLRKLKKDYHEWDVQIGLDQIFEEIYESWKDRF